MPVEQDVKAYSLIMPEKLLNPKEPSRYRELPEGMIQIGGQYHAGREEFAEEAIRRQTDTIDPAFRAFVGDDGLSLEDTESIVLPEQAREGNKELERAPGNIGEFDKELVRVEDLNTTPSAKANVLSVELARIEKQLKDDIALQKTQIEENNRNISSLRAEVDASSGWLTSIVNVGYSAFHSFSKWAHLGICKEPLTSVEEQNEKVVKLKEQEIELKKVLIGELEERLGKIGAQKNSLITLSSGADENTTRAVVSRALDETREIIIQSKDKSQEIRSLESRLKLQLEAVIKGNETLEAQRSFNEGVCQGIEKGIVIGLAIGGGALVTFMTGGAALPWYTSMVYGLGMAMIASSIQAASHLANGSDVETELADMKTDFKDSVLYSASGVLNRVWVATRALTTAKSLGVAAEVGSAKLATTFLSSLASRFSGFVSGLGAGLRNEIIPAAYDSFYGDSIDVLDPTGEFRQALGKNHVSTGVFQETDMYKLTGIDNFRIRMKNFTERIGSAGAAGATAHSLSGLRGNWGLDRCFKATGSNALTRVCLGLRGAGVEVASDAVELGVDVINGCHVQATWVPFLYGLEQKPKDQREVMQMIASGIGGAVSGRLNNTLRNQAEKHGERLLANAQDRFRATGKNMGDAQGVVGPEVALSASVLPLMLEGNNGTTVAANLGAQHSQLERSSIMQEHRLTGKQADNIDSRKGGVSADLAKNAGQVILAAKRGVDNIDQGNGVGRRRDLAVDTVAKAVERSAQALANTALIEGDYVDKLINARKIQAADRPKGIWQSVLGFIDQAANPYGRILRVDSVIEAEAEVKKVDAEQRLERRQKWLDTNIFSLFKIINIKWGGVKIRNSSLLFYDGQGIEFLGKGRIGLDWIGRSWNSKPVQAVVKSDTVQFVKNFTHEAIVKPVSGIAFGTLLLPTTTIWMGPGVLSPLAGDVTRKTVFGTTTRNLLGAFNQRIIRAARIAGYGDAVAAGEMLNRKVELEVVRDEVQRIAGPNPTDAQKRQIKALNDEIQRTEIHFNRANTVGVVFRLPAWLAARGNNRVLLTDGSRRSLETKIKDTYESALGRRGVVADTVDAASRFTKADISDRNLLNSPDALKNRDQFMAKVDLLLGNDSILTDAKKNSIRGDLIAELGLVRTTSAAQDQIINDLKSEINGNTTAHYKRHREFDTLKKMQDHQNHIDRTDKIRTTLRDLERGTIAPDVALKQLEDLFNDSLLGKEGMINKDVEYYQKFKQTIEGEIRQLSRRKTLNTGTEILLSKEYDELLQGIASGDDKKVKSFQAVFNNAMTRAHPNFIADVLTDPSKNAAGTPMETILRNWSTLNHVDKLQAIIDSENALVNYRALAGPVSPTFTAKCDQLIYDIRAYRQFSIDIIAGGLQSGELNKLIRSSNYYESAPIANQYKSILDFGQRHSNPQSFLEAKLQIYQQLIGLPNPTAAQKAQILSIESEVRDLRLDVGTSIFRDAIEKVKHINQRNRELQGLRNIHGATLSSIFISKDIELDNLMGAISKAGNEGHKEQAVKRQVVEHFVRDLGGDVSRKNIDAIIESEGTEFNDFYRVIGELRNPATRANAEVKLNAALGHVGLDGKKAQTFINEAARPVSAATIRHYAGVLGLGVPEYIDLVDRAYGDRPDLAGTFGRNKFSKAERRKAQEILDKKCTELTEGNNRFTDQSLEVISKFFLI
jgi:hypothetical protein